MHICSLRESSHRMPVSLELTALGLLLERLREPYSVK